MQTVAETAARHGPAGELIDDHHLAVAHQIIHVPLKNHMRLEGLVEMMQLLDAGGIVEIFHPQQFLSLSHPLLGKGQAAGLFIDRVMDVAGEFGDQAVDPDVELGGHVGRAGDDQRGAGLVDQDRVHLIDNGVVEFALAEIVEAEFHVVAQIIEAEFVVGAVGDVGPVGRLAGLIIEAVDDHSHREAEEGVEPAHPFGVATGQIVVDRDHMHPPAGKGVEIDRQGGDQGLSLAGSHFRDFTLMENHAAEELDIEMAHPQHPAGGLPHHRKGLGQQIVEGGAAGQPLLELSRLGDQGCVIEGPDLRGQGVDSRHGRGHRLEQPVIMAAKHLVQKLTQHYPILLGFRPGSRPKLLRCSPGIWGTECNRSRPCGAVRSCRSAQSRAF